MWLQIYFLTSDVSVTKVSYRNIYDLFGRVLNEICAGKRNLLLVNLSLKHVDCLNTKRLPVL